MTAITDPAMIEWPPAPEESTLACPRILCLHGGGTNARIFHMQCRALAHNLKAKGFRLIFAEAPFPATAGPDVLTVYADWGPFKRWVLTVAPNAVERRPAETWAAIDASLGVAVRRDDETGATGEWVAVMGFSQGAKIAASLLLRMQERPETMARIFGGLEEKDEGKRRLFAFKAGMLMAGRGPLVPLIFDGDDDDDGHEQGSEEQETQNKKTWLGRGERFDLEANRAARRVLSGAVPTIHVHGLQDPGLEYHRVLLEDWCELGSTALVEWEGNHRLPFKTGDVATVVDALVGCLKRGGVVAPPGPR